MAQETYGNQSYIEHFRQGGSGAVVEGELLSGASRARKARKICAVLRDYFARPLDDLACLDIGCSGGHITHALAAEFREVIGIDTDEPALDIARALGDQPGLRFEQASATELPFADATFDVVVCNHVYEHINSQEAMFAEIYRALKPGGVCYLGAGNRFVVIEPHYRLPMLSWPPKRVSNAYLRALGRDGEYLEKHRSYWGLRRLVRSFVVHDYTARILADPRRFAGGDSLYNRLPTRWLPESVLRAAAPAFPTYIWLLEKQA